MNQNHLREAFLKFFEEKGHKRLPSSSLLPENDPSVLFTTAGMQQFKRYYLFPDEAPSSRVVTCQKCVRTGDIDEVGDKSHLTFFEMLGNFSFGYKSDARGQKPDSRPYYKEDAINWAWEFLTEELKIDKSRIYATYFKDEADDVPEDIESLEILKKIEGLQEIRAQGFEDNFWSLGTDGSPGGPTVEFYVLSPEALAKGNVDGVEVWNLVFNEFVMKSGTYEPSDLKGVDTGMGLERLAAVMQGKSDVYQTDAFAPIILELEKISGKKYEENQKEFRIITDHIRSAVFLAAEDIYPGNVQQGYVLRKLIRRSMRVGREIGITSTLIPLAYIVIKFMGNIYPELREGPEISYFRDDVETKTHSGELLLNKFSDEEEKFAKTIEGGLKTFDAFLNKHIELNKDNGLYRPVVGGEFAFDMFQTFGFPLELTLEEFRNRGIQYIDPEVNRSFSEKMKAHQEKSRTASAGMFKGGLADNKIETTRLHTAAHLLLAALRHELGGEIEQKGSNITEERLRFDFNYPEKLTDEQIKKIEDLVNLKIEEALPVAMQELSLEEAKNSGATGSFHERYGDVVKIFIIGPASSTSSGPPFSREICGGPHVKNTSELSHFEIIKEESSSAGVRRIKAVLN